MKRNVLLFGTIVIMGGLLSSCDSNDDVSCPEDFSGALTAEEGQLVGSWALSAIVSDTALDMTDDGEVNPSTDFFAQYGDCQKDAIYTFGTDRSYTFEQSQNTESCDNAITLDGTWRLASNQLSLVSGCSLQNNVLEIAGNGQSLSFSGDFSVRDVNGALTDAKITFTYSLVPQV